MRVLLIEDDEQFLEDVVPSFAEVVGTHGNLTVAKSRDSAIAALNKAASNNEFYDLFVLDLGIPPTDGEGDEDVKHGMAVFDLSVPKI
jgi:hypothetical protein